MTFRFFESTPKHILCEIFVKSQFHRNDFSHFSVKIEFSMGELIEVLPKILSKYWSGVDDQILFEALYELIKISITWA